MQTLAMQQTDFKRHSIEKSCTFEQGVLSVEDADAAVSWGPGLRWGLMGPNMLWHIGGGEGGIQQSWKSSWTHWLP